MTRLLLAAGERSPCLRLTNRARSSTSSAAREREREGDRQSERERARSRSQGKNCEDLPLQQQLLHMQKQMCLASMSPHDCLTNLTRESWLGRRQGLASGGRFFLPLHAIALQVGQSLLVEVCSPRSQSGACAELQPSLLRNKIVRGSCSGVPLGVRGRSLPCCSCVSRVRFFLRAGAAALLMTARFSQQY